MRAHYLQHASFEGLGSIAAWLERRSASVGRTLLFRGEALPSPSEVDLLIVMGGPMSVNDEERLPWLRPEKRLIREVLDRGTPVLGICLGAQLIAAALGARVRPAPAKEIGWFPVTSVRRAPGRSPFALPTELRAFHWHGETFDLPRGAIHLARSPACEHQAFSVGRSVLALQFHLEVTPEGVRELVRSCPEDLAPGPYAASEAELLRAEPTWYVEAAGVLGGLLDLLVTGIEAA